MIVVLSDHLSMRNKATPMLKASRMPSRLTFFVNTPDSEKDKNINPGTHYDIAPTILKLLDGSLTIILIQINDLISGPESIIY